jgi:hypothetical protein
LGDNGLKQEIRRRPDKMYKPISPEKFRFVQVIENISQILNYFKIFTDECEFLVSNKVI